MGLFSVVIIFSFIPGLKSVVYKIKILKQRASKKQKNINRL